jgi:rhomboid protease GluP
VLCGPCAKAGGKFVFSVAARTATGCHTNTTLSEATLTERAKPETVTIAFGRPPLLPRTLLLQAGRIGLVLAATVLSVPAKPGQGNALPIIFAIEFIVVVAAMVGAQIRLRRAGGLPPIELGPDGITLPRNSLSLRGMLVPYADVRAATLLGRGGSAQVVVDTRRRAWRFPRGWFAAADALSLLRQGLKAHVLAMPDGAARWAGIDARHGAAERLALSRPWGSWTIGLLVAACFAVQAWLVHGPDALGLIDAGGNAAFLVRHGEWFRLVTASLLHLNARHMLGNALFLVVIGSMLEPLIGFSQFLLVLLFSCVASQLVSCLFALHSGSYIYAIGLSGGLYGLLGALAAVTLRFGASLPGGFRLPGRAWLFFAASVVIFPFLVTGVDHAAHAGGLIAGLLVGGVLLLNRADLAALAAPHRFVHIALAALLLLWGAGIGEAFRHETDPAARAADRYVLATGMLDQPRFPPLADNEVAWAIAIDPAAPQPALQTAHMLARQAFDSEWHDKKRYQAIEAAILDTDAALNHRLGNNDRAIYQELGLVRTGPQATTHLGTFVQAAWRHDGLTRQGDAGPAPSLTIGQGVLRLTALVPVVKQTDVLALLYHNKSLAGVLRFQLVPGFSGTQILPLPSNTGAPGTSAPPSYWTDGQSSIDIVRMDGRGCHCQWPTLVPGYYAYDPAFADLP